MSKTFNDKKGNNGWKFAGREDAVGEQRHKSENEYSVCAKDSPATNLDSHDGNKINSKGGIGVKTLALIQYMIG